MTSCRSRSRSGKLQRILDRWLHEPDPARDDHPAASEAPTADRARGEATTSSVDIVDVLGAADVLDVAQFDWLRQLADASADPGLLRSFVDQYLDQAATEVGRLRYAAGRGDIAEVQLLAHGLGGTSATIGAAGVASASALLEGAAAHGQMTTPEGLDRLSREIARASAALLAQAPVGAS